MMRGLTRLSVLCVIVSAVLIAGCSGGGGDGSGTLTPQVESITAAQLEAMMNDGQALVILDVRTAGEFTAGHLPGAVNIPLADLSGRLGELEQDDRIVCVCGVGSRSAQAANTLVLNGFTGVHNLSGGLATWTGALE
jgi:rhodanese-related sulfurtransferase